ncbi:hypothetical protein QBC39DRAFT_48026 [Podospora conica]|nr:hypothetical protein QBC39DRAFT_48026 [Schizothecium conicum]
MVLTIPDKFRFIRLAQLASLPCDCGESDMCLARLTGRCALVQRAWWFEKRCISSAGRGDRTHGRTCGRWGWGSTGQRGVALSTGPTSGRVLVPPTWRLCVCVPGNRDSAITCTWRVRTKARCLGMLLAKVRPRENGRPCFLGLGLRAVRAGTDLWVHRHRGSGLTEEVTYPLSWVPFGMTRSSMQHRPPLVGGEGGGCGQAWLG